MPSYSYACKRCGEFSADRPMARFKAPAKCPGCGALSERGFAIPFLNSGRLERSPRFECDNAVKGAKATVACSCCD
jgi:putative FmdB family regulatory protein